MRFKGTLILLIVCLALGAFVYFYEIKGGEEREKAEQAEKQLWELEDKDIRQIDFIFPDRQITAERRGEEEWLLTNPRRLEADSDELNRLASSAAKMKRESIVEPNAENLAKFGLDPSQSSLKLTTSAGEEYTVSFGNNNPTGNSAYAVLPDQKEVFLVLSSVVNSFNKKLEDLRNRSVLDFRQQDVQSLSLKNPEGDFKLTKDADDRWWIEAKAKIAADSPGIRGILNTLSMAEIEEFFDENRDDYANLRLDKPFIDVSLTYGPDKAIKHLIIGSEKSKIRSKTGKRLEQKDSGQTGTEADASSEIYLAEDQSREDLFFVDKDLVDKLLQSRLDLRDKALASFQRWDIDSMSLTNPQGSYAFTKTAGEWFVGEEKKKAKWDAVNGILDALEKDATEWIDTPASLQTYGLDKPVIHVVLKQGDQVIVDCSLGKSKKADTVYARIEGDPSVKVAGPESFSLLDKGESDLIESPQEDTPETDTAEE